MPVSEDMHRGSSNILHIQVNGVPVNTAGGGDLTKELCAGESKLLNMVQRMATGNTLFTVALHSPTKVQLVP